MSSLAADVSVSGRPDTGADLRMLVILRSFAIVGQTIALAVSGFALNVQLPVAALGAGVALFAVFNLITWDRLNRARRLDDRAYFRQILVDIGVLTYLLFLAGGPVNPFHDMYLLPLTIAAAALPWHYVWKVAAVSLSCFTLVMFVHVPLQIDIAQMRHLLIFGEWTNHVIIALLVSYFVVRISTGLRERDRQLAEAREKELRNGCTVALGSVAAGVAHELGTPLSTISIVLGELREDYADHAELQRGLDVIAGRMDACRKSLDNLRGYVNSLNSAEPDLPVDAFLENVVRRFRNVRPGIHVTRALEGGRPGPKIVTDLALQQAIVNLLNNAADVSPQDVSLRATWDERMLTIEICDKGPGITPDLADKLGKLLITTKPPEAGTGLGLFLTNVTMNRLGGRLRLYNQEQGGACAEIVVPLATLAKKGNAK